MIVTVNGQSRTFADTSTLQDAVAHCCKNPRLVICELNGAIIEPDRWTATPLNANDRLELISFVGGG